MSLCIFLLVAVLKKGFWGSGLCIFLLVVVLKKGFWG